METSAASAVHCTGKWLGGVLDSLSAVKPLSLTFPEPVEVLRTCGDGAVASLGNGKVVLITVNPVHISDLLSSGKPHTKKVWTLAVSSDHQMVMSGTPNGEVKL